MDLDRASLMRVIIGATILALLVAVAYVMVTFVAVVVFAVFLYYAVRPIFRSLTRFGLGRRVRAMLSILLFGVPFLVLIAYTLAVVAVEVRRFLTERDFVEATTEQLVQELNFGGLNLDSLEELVAAEGTADLDFLLSTSLDAFSLVGSLLVQLLLVVIGTYYLLVDGPRLVAWLLDTYDPNGVGREYVEAVDAELSLALFGNIVNVFITAIVGMTTFYVYNLLVASTVAVPFPALLGALAGIGSLIPVIGIKIVYIPLCLGLAGNAWIAGEPELLVPVTILFVVSAIVVDFIPDFVIRAQVSSDKTHTGLLLIAYIIGPSIVGFYGLFLAPIILVAVTNSITILLPSVLSDTDDDSQRTLDSFADREDSDEPAN